MVLFSTDKRCRAGRFLYDLPRRLILSVNRYTFEWEKLSMDIKKASFLIALGFGLFKNPAVAAADLAEGEKVFKKCKACHFVDS